MKNRLENEVAIVTGAGSIKEGIGNGKAAAIVYAREGAKVMLVDKNKKAAEETKKIIDEEGGECFTFEGNITNSSDCKRMAKKCKEKYGKIDILHNNVGITKPGGAVELSEENWDKIINVNLKGMFLTCKYTLPYMIDQHKGVIVNVSSINAIRSIPNAIAIAYATSKGGVNAFTREIAVQYASEGIRANAVLPGLMKTPMVEASLKDSYGGEIEEMHKRRASMCPMNKQGEAWDTAYAALFLASSEAKYVNGETLVVDGGIIGTIPYVD